MFWRGHHCYEVCGVCGKLVRLNKPLLGSLHICLTEEERNGFVTRDGCRKVKRSVITHENENGACGFIEFEDE
jgi:hypothetical protein